METVLKELEKAFDTSKNSTKGKPTVLIANTIKGKGSSIMENKANWHHKVPTKEEYDQIMADFKKKRGGITNNEDSGK